ncbi:MAG: hypothetical protein GSR84_08185 [Desulfurococcales archaeon]|nr:hypothetical protein [Desulfurococcales archaeon]
MYRSIRGLEGGEVYRYTSSISHDHRIYRDVVAVLMAHALHLREKGLIPGDSWDRVRSSLLQLASTPPSEVLKPGYEDVFEAIEAWLSRSIGEDAGWIWLGRSRNDHVAAALRLYTLRAGYKILVESARLRVALAEKAAEQGNVILPGFTHGQASQVLTGSCLFTAYEEAVEEVEVLLEAALGASLKSPLGAGAGAGSVAPLDEARLAQLLGFTRVYSSPYYASGSRLFLESVLASLAVLGVEASRIAEDLIALAELGVARLPRGHIATSSIMPHKENPATLEIVRSLGSRLIGLAQAGLGIPLKLRYSYNLDLQEANPVLYQALDDAALVVEALASVVKGVELDPGKGAKLVEELRPWSSELAETIAVRDKVPLRSAYSMVAKAIVEGRLVELAGEYGLDPARIPEARRTGCSRERMERVVGERLDSARRVLGERVERLRRLENVMEGLASLLRGRS